MSETQQDSPENIARLFRYYAQDNNPRVEFKRELGRIPVKTFYTKYKKYFDRIHLILVKYKIDPSKFIKFCVTNIRVFHPKKILDTEVFSKYASYLQVQEQYKKIYSQYMKTVEFIAESCLVKRVTPRKFMRDLVTENRLAYEYMAGRISKYFIVTLNDFDEFFPKMDSLNQDELRIIFNAKDELVAMTQDAFLMHSGKRAKPITLIEGKLKQKILNQMNNQNQTGEYQCVHSAQT